MIRANPVAGICLTSWKNNDMKKYGLLLAFCALTFVNTSYSQTGAPVLLHYYYGVKDALVAGDATTASAQAGNLLKAIDSVDMKKLTPAQHSGFMSLKDKLAMDARHISEVTVISHQREHFASLSSNMFLLARTVPLSDQPIYQDYCPMKKSYWLSSESAIRNPYFGSGMLTCGSVTATLKQ
jgi:hypothetical protein